MRILVESSGSLISAFMINAIQDCGYQAFASDVDSDCHGRFLADGFVQFPKKNDPKLWQKIKKLLAESKIDVVLPSFDETLSGWAARKGEFLDMGIHVIISDSDVIETFLDKFKAFSFFKKIQIPTPETSLEKKFPLVKPRFGRGGSGVIINSKEMSSMDGLISQELVVGVEYTVDVFCDFKNRPVYIVPRRRLNVIDGKSTAGIVEEKEKISGLVKKICSETHFIGPINLQCFEKPDGGVVFIEINPRVGGGMALGFAASENWVSLSIKNLIEKQDIQTKPIKYGLKMRRYYSEIFFD